MFCDVFHVRSCRHTILNEFAIDITSECQRELKERSGVSFIGHISIPVFITLCYFICN
jgi:hypothetical protein